MAPRPLVERLIRPVAILLVLGAAALLAMGGQVTSLGAGMSDPVWPTRPTYLAENQHVWSWNNVGFLVEHSHRALGFLTGGLASILTILVWLSEPKRGLRWLGLLVAIGLLSAYGQFHREMGVAAAERAEALQKGQATESIPWPKNTGIATLALAVTLIGCAVISAWSGSRGSTARTLASIGLVAVMLQGLLGGFRVFLHQLVGPELAAIHGTFGQVVFCIMLSVMVFSAPMKPSREVAAIDRDRVGRLALLLPILLFMQLVWGVLVRHTGSPLAQRLHILTAFLATGMTLWLIISSLATPTGRKQLGFLAYHLLGILIVQVLLGVEAWMGKFAASSPEAFKPVEMRTGSPMVRTLHMLIGAGLLGASVVYAIKVWRRSDAGTVPGTDNAPETQSAAPAIAVA